LIVNDVFHGDRAMDMVRTPTTLFENIEKLSGKKTQNLLREYLKSFQAYRADNGLLVHIMNQWSCPAHGQPSRVPVGFENFCYRILRKFHVSQLRAQTVARARMRLVPHQQLPQAA
jgi:hypothetical protein